MRCPPGRVQFHPSRVGAAGGGLKSLTRRDPRLPSCSCLRPQNCGAVSRCSARPGQAPTIARLSRFYNKFRAHATDQPATRSVLLTPYWRGCELMLVNARWSGCRGAGPCQALAAQGGGRKARLYKGQSVPGYYRHRRTDGLRFNTSRSRQASRRALNHPFEIQ